MNGPLEGIRVVDFSRLLPGPLTALCLADLGAEVIKVEGMPDGDYARRMGADDPPLGIGKDHSAIGFIGLNQNKKSLQVDHRTREGLAVIDTLVRSADVFVQSTRPGSLAKHGLDAETLCSINPRLVYCSVTAYGDFGPYGNWPGHGYNIEANAGLLGVSEDPDGALRLPEYSVLVASVATGYQAAMAVSAALLKAARTGLGSVVEVAAFDAGVSFDPTDIAHALNGVDHDATIGTRQTPKYAAYKTKDGEPILLATIEGKPWTEFCTLIDRPDLAPRHDHTSAFDWGNGHPELYDELAEIFAVRTLADWMNLVESHPLPISPINTTSQVTHSKHFLGRDLTRTTTSRSGKTVQTIRPAAIVDHQRLGAEGRWSELGEDTEEVLTSLGYDEDAIRTLVRDGVVRCG